MEIGRLDALESSEEEIRRYSAETSETVPSFPGLGPDQIIYIFSNRLLKRLFTYFQGTSCATMRKISSFYRKNLVNFISLRRIIPKVKGIESLSQTQIF